MLTLICKTYALSTPDHLVRATRLLEMDRRMKESAIEAPQLGPILSPILSPKHKPRLMRFLRLLPRLFLGLFLGLFMPDPDLSQRMPEPDVSLM